MKERTNEWIALAEPNGENGPSRYEGIVIGKEEGGREGGRDGADRGKERVNKKG